MRPNHYSNHFFFLAKNRSHHTSCPLVKLEPSASISNQLQNAPAILQPFMPQHKLDIQTFIAPCRLDKNHLCCRAVGSGDKSAGASMLLPSTELLYSAIPLVFRTQQVSRDRRLLLLSIFEKERLSLLHWKTWCIVNVHPLPNLHRSRLNN